MIMSTEEINKIKLLVGHYVVMCIGVGVYLLRLVLKSVQAQHKQHTHTRSKVLLFGAFYY